MRYRNLGDRPCSEVSLGTWSFNSRVYGEVSERDAVATVRQALEEGITLYDSAPLYGSAEEDGIAERVLGKALGADRGRVLISTKFGRRATKGNRPDFNAANARSSVEESLRRLGTDRIDVLFFHSPFGADEIEDDVWDELDRLREEGKVLRVGHSISKFADTEGMARQWALERRIEAVQVVYSLLNREATSLIADLSGEGIVVVARESLANGFLTGRVSRNTVFPKGSLNARHSRDEIAERVAQVERLGFLVREPITSMPCAAMRWVLDNPGVTTVLTGARNSQEVAECAAASGLPDYSEKELRKAKNLHTRDFPAA